MIEAILSARARSGASQMMDRAVMRVRPRGRGGGERKERSEKRKYLCNIIQSTLAQTDLSIA